jgi:Protein of unknown function (DUF3224)
VKDEAMTEGLATGAFEVKLGPTGGPDPAIGAITIAKTFHGDLDGASAGLMLSAGSPVSGSAGYVAMERVTARLAGRRGGFALQHSGTMDKGAMSLSVLVSPGSGTEGLAGIAGSMEIVIAGGKHEYRFRYTLPD